MVVRQCNHRDSYQAMTPMLKELKENLHGRGMIYAFRMYKELP